MAYTDLVIQQTITLTEGCTEGTVVDNTGTYPTEAGGFSESGSGTATRPAEDQVVFWYMWRRMDSEGVWQETIPESQTGDPEATISLLQESGERFEDAAWQVIEMVMPSASDWDNFSALTWDEIIVGILAVGALGQAPLFSNCTEVFCTNDALERLNNAWASGNCKTDEYALKKSFLQGATDSINLAGATTNEEIISLDTTERYQKTQTIIDTLVEICNDPQCLCNC